MTKKLTTNQKVINLVKRAYKLAKHETCNYDCRNCELKHVEKKVNEKIFGDNGCPQVQFKWACRELFGELLE